MDTLPELLAPAGDWNSFVAAVQNGANAVYLGTTQFSARQDAENFSLEQLLEAVPYAHSRGCRIYVAINTLISGSEMPEAIKLAETLGDLGVDGLIVQDLGLAANLRLLLPEIPLHASTQMTIHNAQGIAFLAELGFTRVVLARELSLVEITEIVKNSPLECEVFAHGALCFSYSGDCLLSSMIGGRSGNRGRCAQPCRLEYSLINSEGKVESGDSGGPYLLSPKDLNTLEHLPDLVKAGVKSLKIEGRLKRPEYVATVVKAYRLALDNLKNPGNVDFTQIQREVAQVFNRDFTAGYLYNNPGRDLISYQKPSNRGRLLGRVKQISKGLVWIELNLPCAVGDGYEIWQSENGRSGGTIRSLLKNSHNGWQEVQQAEPGEIVAFEFSGPASVGDLVYKNRENFLLHQAGSTYKSEHENLAIPVKLRVSAKIGKPCTVSFTDPLHLCGTAKTEFIVEKALHHPMDEEDLFRQLNRLGNTPFVIEDYHCEIDPGIMVPKSELNQVRREAIANLFKARLAYFTPTRLDNLDLEPIIKRYSDCLENINQQESRQEPVVSVVVDTWTSLERALLAGANLVYLADTGFSPTEQTFDTVEKIGSALDLCSRHGANGIFTMPPISTDRQLIRYQKIIRELVAQQKPLIVSVGDYGALQIVSKLGVPFHSEPQLNTFNSSSADLLTCLGARLIHLSPELTLKQLGQLNQGSAGAKEILVHGHQIVMLSKHCVLGSIVGGLTATNPCKAPCAGTENYGLKDRLGKVFPLRTDRHCLMYLFNSVELCLIEHLSEIRKVGVSSIRVEGRLYHPDQLEQVVRSYVEAWGLVCANPQGSESVKERLIQFRRELEPPTGITKGHLFRGVL